MHASKGVRCAYACLPIQYMCMHACAVSGFDLLPASSLLRLRLISREMRTAVDQGETWCLLLEELDKTNTFHRINYEPISLSSRGPGWEIGATVQIVGLKTSGVCVCARSALVKAPPCTL